MALLFLGTESDPGVGVILSPRVVIRTEILLVLISRAVTLLYQLIVLLAGVTAEEILLLLIRLFPGAM